MNVEMRSPDDLINFDQVYMAYFPPLYKYAYILLQDESAAEDMVHNVFLKIVENSDSFCKAAVQKAFLFRSVYNECMNYIKHKNVRIEYQSKNVQPEIGDEGDTSSLQYKELSQEVVKALNLLPEQCRRVFQMSRYEELRYKEIAELLNITVSTVEKHMVKALKRLTIQLEDYLPLLIILFLT